MYLLVCVLIGNLVTFPETPLEFCPEATSAAANVTSLIIVDLAGLLSYEQQKFPKHAARRTVVRPQQATTVRKKPSWFIPLGWEEELGC